MLHAFQAAVIQIDMGQLHFLGIKAFQVHTEAMIL